MRCRKLGDSLGSSECVLRAPTKLWFSAKFFLTRECAEPHDWPVETGLSQLCQLSWPSVTSFSHLSLKYPLHCLTSCGTSWVRIFQEWNYFLSYHHAADHSESSFGICWCDLLVMATLGVFPDHAQGRLPYNALPSIPSRTLYLPTAPVPLGHSSTTAHRKESFLQWLSPLLDFDFHKGGDSNLDIMLSTAPCTVLSIFIALITHVIQGNIKFTS